ncbi:MAG: tail fiber domain-containing protein [Spirosomataceae bacterium]
MKPKLLMLCTGVCVLVAFGVTFLYSKQSTLSNLSSVPSDYRLKHNIDDMSNGLQIIRKLHPKTFNYNTQLYPDFGLSKDPQFGFIAQELERVLPMFVHETQFPDQKLFKTVNYTGLIPILVQGMQEQQEMIDKQQEEINTLRAKLKEVSDLNARLEHLEAVLGEGKANSLTEVKQNR